MYQETRRIDSWFFYISFSCVFISIYMEFWLVEVSVKRGVVWLDVKIGTSGLYI